MRLKSTYAAGSLLASTATVVLIATAMATQYWTTGTMTETNSTVSTNCTVYRHIGLFSGTDEKQEGCISSEDDVYSVTNSNCLSMNVAARNAVIAFCGISLLAALLAAGISGLNICYNPTDEIWGPVGIFVLYGIALVANLTQVIIYTVMLYNDLYQLNETPENSSQTCEECASDTCKYEMDQDAYFGYSFFLTVISLVTTLLGIVCVYLSNRDMAKELKKMVKNPNKDMAMKAHANEMIY